MKLGELVDKLIVLKELYGEAVPVLVPDYNDG